MQARYGLSSEEPAELISMGKHCDITFQGTAAWY